MHPLLNRKTWFAAYLFLWAILAGLLAELLHDPGLLGWSDVLVLAAALCLFYAFVCLAPWYVCASLPLGSVSWAKLAFNHMGAAVLATALWIGVARIVATELQIGKSLSPELPHLVAVGLLLYILSVAFHYVFLTVEASRRAVLQARDAELRALKSQINPHFLFNCLNSITALTSVDPARARQMCIRLGDFLRSTLGLGERESIAWREEIELARAYLDVEKIRFGARLEVEMNIDDDCSDCQVPPLLLQPLIENAVKHGIATLVDGGTIRVTGQLRDGRLRVSVENAFDPESPSSSRHGLGLRNVRDRLETRFGSAASLTARTADNSFRVDMALPCQKSE